MREASDGDEWKQRYEALVAERDALNEKLASITKRYAGLLHEYEKLKRQLTGPKRESPRAHEAQLSLLGVLEALGRLQAGDEGAGDEAEAALERAKDLVRGTEKKRKSKPHGRRKLSLEDLPVEQVVIEPPERSAPGGDKLVHVGDEVTEYLERIPASMTRVRVVMPKYVDPEVARYGDVLAPVDDVHKLRAPLAAARVMGKRARFIVAERPELPIPRCLAGPGLLAHVLVSKYGDHIPLHRQERILRREGVRIAGSTLGNWVSASTRLLSRLVEAMWKDARDNATYLMTDATGILVQEKARCRNGHFYVVVVPKQHVLFRFTDKNDGDRVASILNGFSGYVHADAATVYHELYRSSDLVEVGCWAHARRKFFEALASDRERALIGIGFISRLYDVQRATWRHDKQEAGTKQRAELARPILRAFWQWVRCEFDEVDEGTPIRAALGYLKNQRLPLLRFLRDGKLRLDNNPSELELRRLVVGRKNWLFCGSESGAEYAAVAVSLIASCEMHGVEPWAYLRDVLTLLPAWDQRKVLELTPKYWKETAARVETQGLLDQLDVRRRAKRSSPAQATSAA